MVNLMGPPPNRAAMLVGSQVLPAAPWQIWFNQVANSIAALDNASGGGNSGGTGSNGNNPSINGGGFTQVITPGNAKSFKPAFALDGVTDDSLALQTLLDNNLSPIPGTYKIISPLGMYINAFVTVNNFQTLEMSECMLYRGPNCSIGTNGQPAEIPAGGGASTSKPHLYSNISSGATSFQVVIFSANVAPATNDQFILRGQRDVTGKVPEQNREIGYISTAVNTGTPSGGGIIWIITPVDTVKNSYLVNYAPDAYSMANTGNDFSAFTIAVFSPFSTDIAAGTAIVTVTNAALFNIGDWVFVSDRQTVGSATGITDTNPINQEVNRIVDVNTGTNTITLQQSLHHSYLTAYNGGITTLTQGEGVRLIGINSTFLAASSAVKNYGTIFRYSVYCYAIDNRNSYARIGGVNYAQYGEAFRMQNCFACGFLRCDFEGTPNESDYPSAQGYGLVMNGCADCWFIGGVGNNARHDVLVQDGSCGFLVADRIINNPRISGLDTHGINARDGLFSNIVLNGGVLFSPDSTLKAAIRCGNSSHIYGDFNIIFDGIIINGFAYNTESSGANQGYGLDYVVESGGITFRNIVMNGVDYGIHCKYNTSHTSSALGGDCLAQNILIKNAALGATYFDGGSSQVVGGITLDNVICDGNAIHFFGQNLSGITLIDSKVINSVATTNQPTVQFTNCLDVDIIGNDFDGCNEGIHIKQCPAAQIINNNMRNQIQPTVFKDDTSTGNNNGYIYEGNLYPGTSNPVKSLGTSTGTLKDPYFQNINAQTGTAYTFAQIDESNIVTANNAAAQTYTIPTNSTVPFQIGAKIDIIPIGAGAVTIAGAGGVTYAGSTITAPGSIKKIATNTWV